MAEQDEARRLADLLRVKILSSGRSQREVERHLEWGKGYISQLLRGSFDLKVKHVFSILEVIGIDPQVFFGELFALVPAVGTTAAVAAAGHRLGPEDLAAIRPHLAELVREILAEERGEERRRGPEGRISA